jgi:hypothetical protein
MGISPKSMVIAGCNPDEAILDRRAVGGSEICFSRARRYPPAERAVQVPMTTIADDAATMPANTILFEKR